MGTKTLCLSIYLFSEWAEPFILTCIKLVEKEH